MDINQARFLFEVQRVSDRVAAECQYASTPKRAGTARPTSLRHAAAEWLHSLASRVDAPAPQSV
ncbi:hypothetical protein GCM10008955_38260 [Deinococcus malanensis]|uniref:Uncharacterized protein n=1 Tax=Deinococcus malanensis TaxID=1706855 RepID=A0ABQ2F2I3_9DEIO|nr:hypothetical protein [Deinococcus malanensis]GGK40834.1 hypothetical protein GCM10008955_38260 [Deinococcus malanensis]